MNLERVRQGLADAAGTNTLASKPKLQCLGYEPDAITPPTFYPEGADTDFYPEGENIGQMIKYTIICKLLFGKFGDKAAQKRLDDYLSGGQRSIRHALEADPTLGGACEALLVRRTSDYGRHDVGGQPYLGCNVEVYVWGFDDAGD